MQGTLPRAPTQFIWHHHAPLKTLSAVIGAVRQKYSESELSHSTAATPPDTFAIVRALERGL
jgi:hypothetical protein